MGVRLLDGKQRRDVARTRIIIFELVELIGHEVLELDQEIQIGSGLVVLGQRGIERIDMIIGYLGNAEIGLAKAGLDGEIEA